MGSSRSRWLCTAEHCVQCCAWCVVLCAACGASPRARAQARWRPRLGPAPTRLPLPPATRAQELLGSVPYVMLWLRYTGFIVLYPIGVASELTMVYLALSLAPKKLARLSITMPNPLNMAFDYYVVCLVIVATYVPGLPMLYGYMLSQRRKILGGQGQAKKQQ